MKQLFRLRLLGWTTLFLTIFWIRHQSVAAQPGLPWAPVQRIPGYNDDVRTPILIADQNQTVHAFISQTFDNGELAIFYRQWTLEGGWTPNNDILLGPRGWPRLMDAHLDGNGLMHTVFFSGNEFGAHIYYAQAPAAEAARAPSWSAPLMIGEQASPPAVAALAVYETGEMIMLYNGLAEGRGLYVTESFDTGTTWSSPLPIYLTYDDDKFPSYLYLYLDQQERLHAFWSIGNLTGNSEAIYYARLDESSGTWSEPTVFALSINYEADTPAVIEYNGELIVIYHNELPTTRFERRSTDGGATWSEPVRLFPHEGSNGPVSYALDSANNLHMFFGNRVGNPILYGMWYTVRQNGQWRYPREIIAGERIADLEEGKGFDPSFATTVVSQGNLILLIWRTDPGAGPNGLWYSYATLDTPALPIEVPPTPIVLPTKTPVPPVVVVSPTPALGKILKVQNSSGNPTADANPGSSLALGALVTTLFTFGSIVMINQRRK